MLSTDAGAEHAARWSQGPRRRRAGLGWAWIAECVGLTCLRSGRDTPRDQHPRSSRQGRVSAERGRIADRGDQV